MLKKKEIFPIIFLFLITSGVFIIDFFIIADDFYLILPYSMILFFSNKYNKHASALLFLFLIIIFVIISHTNILSDSSNSKMIHIGIKTIFLIGHWYIYRMFFNNLAKIQQLSIIDELTSAYNRRGMNIVLDNQLKSLERTKGRIALLYIDLDNFKYENDTKGHRVGDTILVSISKCIKDCIRSSDTFVRLGGDEFCIIFLHMSKMNLKHITERIAGCFKESASRNNWGVTLSIGAVTSNKIYNLENLLQAGDRAMYASKRNGKDTVTYQEI